MNSAEKPSVTAHGPIRRVLKLMVKADSAPSWLSRLRAGLVLLALLAGFALLGYGIPSLIAHHLN